MGKVIGINSGIVGAAGTAGAVKAAPGAVAGAMQHPEKLAAGSKAFADFASGWFDPGPPSNSFSGYAGSGFKWMYNKQKQRK